ncbi:ABC-2 type transport system permease protein [Leucobacter luti]|uniref:ABC transporter permease n=1 Tax=Leucobacter luti TaxID=340320 RepID=UPI001046FD9F|nr:ABC transporter permease [Leucobacter luti]MCW2289506.1 ABC-2 type transport system permease protein [Leucobacter luti]TCK33883.1 ABC-2 type transport system permease protein [Leucobacter luti]
MSALNTRSPMKAPSIVSSGLAAIGFELRAYFRVPDVVFFTFLFPILMLGIFGAAFQSMGDVGTLPDGSGGISLAAYYVPGLVAAGILLSGVQNLAIDITRERYEGSLRRLGATPMSPVSYFIGKIGVVVVTALLQSALLLVFAAVVFRVELPTDLSTWLRFAWLFALGIATMTLLGIALSALPRSTRSASAVVIPIVLVLQFVSGVYLQFTMLPEWLQNVASVFPLKWLAQGMRSVFLPAHLQAAEAGGTWNLGLVALMLLVWLVVGLGASLLTFRWQRRS